MASFIVFSFSAVFHEYLISVPLKMLKFYAFAGMFVQVPLGMISELVCKNFGPRYGNMIVWLSLICGQPVAIIMYVYEYKL